MIPSVFGLKGMAVAAVIGLCFGGYASYRITDAFGSARAGARRDDDDLAHVGPGARGRRIGPAGPLGRRPEPGHG